MNVWSCTLLIGVAFLFVLGATELEEARQKLVCYTETWTKVRESPMDYDIDCFLPAKVCDYLILTFLTLDDSTWTLKMHNGYTPVERSDLEKGVRAREKSPAMKVLISVGGWEDGVTKYSNMISDIAKRKAFIDSAVQVLDDYGLDGMELHWLYPGSEWRGGWAEDRRNFLQLVKELTKAFKPRHWILTACVPPDQDSLLKGYDVRRLSSILHHLHIRSYDMRGHWNNVAGNHCPLYGKPDETASMRLLNVNDSLSMYVRLGASPRKLVFTFPLLGRSFTLKDPEQNRPGSPTVGPGAFTPYVQVPGIMAYYEICDMLQHDKLKRHFEVSTQTPYAVQDDLWVGYDDEVSLQKKIKFVRDQGLAGAALFHISLDDFTGKCGEAHFLLKKTWSYIHSKS